jgi:hypothetical protein
MEISIYEIFMIFMIIILVGLLAYDILKEESQEVCVLTKSDFIEWGENTAFIRKLNNNEYGFHIVIDHIIYENGTIDLLWQNN